MMDIKSILCYNEYEIECITLLHKIVDIFWHNTKTLLPSKEYKIFQQKRDDDNLGKFDSRTDEGIFLGYSSNKRAYICYNLRLHKIIESANVIIDDITPRKCGRWRK